MTTREHIKALEMQRDELRGRIAQFESGQDLILMGETIQHERRWRRKAEAEVARLKAALLKYPEWLEGGDGMEFGSDECSFCEAMRQDGHADDCIWAGAALSPAEQIAKPPDEGRLTLSNIEYDQRGGWKL